METTVKKTEEPRARIPRIMEMIPIAGSQPQFFCNS